MPSDPFISYDDEAFYGLQQDDFVKPSTRSEKIIKTMEEAVTDDEFHDIEDCKIESGKKSKYHMENMLSQTHQTRSLVSSLKRKKSRTNVQCQPLAWNNDKRRKI